MVIVYATLGVASAVSTPTSVLAGAAALALHRGPLLGSGQHEFRAGQRRTRARRPCRFSIPESAGMPMDSRTPASAGIGCGWRAGIRWDSARYSCRNLATGRGGRPVICWKVSVVCMVPPATIAHSRVIGRSAPSPPVPGVDEARRPEIGDLQVRGAMRGATRMDARGHKSSAGFVTTWGSRSTDVFSAMARLLPSSCSGSDRRHCSARSETVRSM